MLKNRQTEAAFDRFIHPSGSAYLDRIACQYILRKPPLEDMQEALDTCDNTIASFTTALWNELQTVQIMTGRDSPQTTEIQRISTRITTFHSDLVDLFMLALCNDDSLKDAYFKRSLSFQKHR